MPSLPAATAPRRACSSSTSSARRRPSTSSRRTPRAEALIALAGPAGQPRDRGGPRRPLAFGILAVSPDLGPVADVLIIIGALDLILAGVSVVPAFPLDGGRLVRAAAWARTGDQRAGNPDRRHGRAVHGPGRC